MCAKLPAKMLQYHMFDDSKIEICLLVFVELFSSFTLICAQRYFNFSILRLKPNKFGAKRKQTKTNLEILNLFIFIFSYGFFGMNCVHLIINTFHVFLFYFIELHMLSHYIQIENISLKDTTSIYWIISHNLHLILKKNSCFLFRLTKL